MLFTLLLTLTLTARAETLTWSPLETSSEIETARTSQNVTITKINPATAKLVLLNKSEHGLEYGIMKLAALNQLLFATNASMFSKSDQSTSIDYMRNFAHLNNDHFSGHQSLFAFNPKKAKLPLAVMVDKDEKGWSSTVKNYETVVQGLRMSKRDGTNVWAKDEDEYANISAVSVSKDGLVYFFFHVGNIKVKDLTAHLLELGLDLRGIMYLDGGHHGAIVYPQGADIESYSGYLFLPNVLGVKSADSNSH